MSDTHPPRSRVPPHGDLTPIHDAVSAGERLGLFTGEFRDENSESRFRDYSFPGRLPTLRMFVGLSSALVLVTAAIDPSEVPAGPWLAVSLACRFVLAASGAAFLVRTRAGHPHRRDAIEDEASIWAALFVAGHLLMLLARPSPQLTSSGAVVTQVLLYYFVLPLSMRRIAASTAVLVAGFLASTSLRGDGSGAGLAVATEVSLGAWALGAYAARKLNEAARLHFLALMALNRLANVDGLTGATSRRAFLEAGEREHDRVRQGGGPASVCLLDIDHFKSVNDTWGHAAGDAVLGRVVACLDAETRSADLVGRVGGEEFGIVFPCTSQVEAAGLAERLRTRIEALMPLLGGEPRRITASFGVASLGPPDASFEASLERADGAMYRAKEGGRNQVAAATPGSGRARASRAGAAAPLPATGPDGAS